jgi:gliding motility-associated-like protein
VATEGGTITVDPVHAIALSSLPATETQTLCINTPITNITYTLSGGATGATVTGLPAGVTASVTGNTLTITGTPTTTTGSPFTYAITTTGNTCTVATEAGTITLNPVHVISLSSIASTANQTLCFGSSISNITYTLSGGATGATVTGLPTGVTSSVTGSTLTITGTPTSALGSPYTIDIITTGNGCAVATASASITIVGAPNILTPTPYVVCDDTLNNDGIYCFNLASKNAEITTDPTVSITYHVTPSDAQTGLNPLSTTSYCVNAAGGLPVYVRVFDPAAPQCPSTVTFQLVVNRLPTVGSITDYQLCDDNNTGDQKEIFDLTTKTTEILGATQLPSDYTVTFYTTQPAAQAGVAGTEITTPTVFQNTINPQTIYVRVVNNTTGCVNATASFILRVNPLPTVLTPFPAYALCDMDQTEIGKEPFNLSSQISSILQGQTSMNVQFYPTLADAQNNPPTNEITTATYTNTQVNSQIIGVRITNTTTGCYATSTLELIVNPLPVLVAQAAPYVLCDSDQNGDTVFDLCSLTSLIDPNSNYTITYHATLPNAQDDVNPLACSYPNNQIGTQILFVRGEDSLGCYSVIQIELIVNPSPEVVTLTSLVECDYDSNPQNGQTSFDLEQQTQTILNGQPTAGSNYIVKYYDNQTNAEDLQFAISITTNFIGSNNQTIWYTVQDIASGCYAVGSFTLVVNAPTVLTTPTLLKVCDTDSIPNDEFTTFDIANYIGVVPGHTLSFYIDSAFTNLITTPTAFINTMSANQTIYVQAINDATGCISTRTLTLSVLKIPTPNTDPMELTQCDDNAPGDGVEVFDLTQNESYIMNADSTVTLHYYPSYTDAVNNTNEILDPTAANVGANVWIRVSSNNFIDSFSENCYVLVEQPIVVNPLPTVNASISAYELCDVNNPGDQKEFFNLTTKTVEILGATQLPSDYTVRFYTTQPAAQAGVAGTEIANPTAFENTSNPQTIYVRVINNATGCVNATAGFELKVNPLPSATAPIDFVTCDTDLLNDGFFNYPLNDLVDDVLGSQSPLNFTVTFYNNQTDAQNGTNQILDEPNYMIYTHRVWIRVTNNTTGCFVLTSFNAQVERLAEPLIVTQNNVNTICVDFDTKVVVRPLLLEATNTVPGSYTYEWFEASAPTTVIGTSSTLWVDTAEPNGATRSYTVVMTSTSGLNNPACSNVSDTFEVIQSGQAVVVGTNPAYVVSNYFDNNQTITVENIDGYGTYQYSLDNGPRQDSPVFENVAFGTHFITIWDTEGGLEASCDPMYIEGIQTIDYPRYFTPNGDGIQDTWNIFGLSDQVNAKIYIFDRFGKLIKQITPQGQGWDGTFNGNPLPSTDYWFTVEYLEATTTKEFKAHFTLKR